VWKGVESALQKKPSWWKKLTFPAAGTVLVGAVVYLCVVHSQPNETAMAAANNKQETVENRTVNSNSLCAENLSEKLCEENASALRRKNAETVSETQNVEQASLPTNFYSDNLSEETSRVVEERVVGDKKTPSAVNASDEQNQKQNAVNQTQNENLPAKILSVKISKDTTVCENTAVKLYAYDAENIRWSTGETKNLITVYPSYTEQYSVTFSTSGTKDTTVYIYVNVVQCTEVHIPNIFTPNGDGLNDVFLAKTNTELKSFEMTIYTATGKQVIFTSKDINRGWDGTHNGQTQPQGMYYYTVRYIDNFGKLIEKQGELLLILQ